MSLSRNARAPGLPLLQVVHFVPCFPLPRLGRGSCRPRPGVKHAAGVVWASNSRTRRIATRGRPMQQTRPRPPCVRRSLSDPSTAPMRTRPRPMPRLGRRAAAVAANPIRSDGRGNRVTTIDDLSRDFVTGWALGSSAVVPCIRPDEFRVVRLRALRGPNYWRLAPVIACDVRLGTLESVTSADIPGFTDRLITMVPTLYEHGCSRGEAGGFVERLREDR